ncbi:MAG: NUDIX hydrolase [Solibacillus sp.]|jgi:ADP-ribose pyrophosphatase YjhB (NUDIX family)|uniref:NUDIX hydrolase n=1 Tax=unclassified Solibacillus TaxID=2637870 RepID=UPI0030F86841
MHNKWLDWAKKIQAISQTGIAFSKNVHDLERYEELRQVSVEIMAHYTDLDETKIKHLFTNETGYQTPKVDVRGVIFRNNQILLVKEKSDEKWALPGGFCDVGLSAGENIVKEIKEETGFDAIPKRILAILDKNKHPHPPDPYHFYKIFVLCEIIGGEATIGIETNDVQFFSEYNLPVLSSSRNTKSQLQTVFEFLHFPEKETLFD